MVVQCHINLWKVYGVTIFWFNRYQYVLTDIMCTKCLTLMNGGCFE